MTLIPNWREVLKYAWSIRMMVVAGAFSALETALPLIQPYYPIPHGLFAALSGVFVGAAFATRLLAQQSVTPPTTDAPKSPSP